MPVGTTIPIYNSDCLYGVDIEDVSSSKQNDKNFFTFIFITQNDSRTISKDLFIQADCSVDKNYAENIDLDNIANEAYFSKFHFIRLFRNIYSSTPHNYLRQVRIEHAKQLLAKNIAPSRVCILVGFDSISSFTGLFKKMTGTTPSAYQLQQQKRKAAIITNPLNFVPACYAHQTGWL